MSYTHAARVDVIYIDPPYNTGNRDFVYNDRFVDREDGYRHSKWLSFMAKRLKLAKTLLKETGVIFISIDDNEQAQLKLLCDELFGAENFVANVVWKSRKMVDSRTKTGVSNDHEYIVTYRKSLTGKLRGAEKDKSKFSNPDNDSRGPWRSADLTGLATKEQRPNLHYELIDPLTQISYSCPPKGWRYERKTMAVKLAEGRILFPSNLTGRPRHKLFQAEMESDFTGFTSVLLSPTTENGTKDLNELFGQAPFDFSKPRDLVKLLLEQAADSDALILDFFAGSGTTLHATMALNAEDGGTRRCILVTNNENNICEQVTYERNRRVIQGYTTPKGVPVPGLTQNSLRYYRCEATVPRVPLLRHKRELVRRATDLLRLKENCYQPLPGTPADGGFRAFGRAAGALVVVYDDLAVEAAAVFVAALPVPAVAPAGQPWCAVYVFAPGSYAYQDEFEAVAPRVRLSALPEALYRAWQPLLPPASPEPTETLVMTGAPGALVASKVARPVAAAVAAPAAKAAPHGSLPLF